MIKKQGTMGLSSITAVALWECEIQGQLSDGMWENTRPFDHWKFWCHTDAVLAFADRMILMPEGVHCMKNSYNLNGLREYVEPRMLAIGRMARAGVPVKDCHAAEYMPTSFEEFKQCKEAGTWKYDFVAKHMEAVSVEQAEAFYAATYTVKDLIADLKCIKTAMKTVCASRW